MNSIASTSSDVEEITQGRKRQRTSKVTNEDKRSRGRPRLDPQDETAAERRRTQIRLAQRAYRQRKETTITALKKHVSELQDTIGEMNKTFLRFSDMATNIGLAPEIVRELKNVTQQFVFYAKAQGSLEEEQETNLVDNEEIVHNLATEPAPKHRSSREQNESGLSSPEYSEDIGLGYRSVYDLSSIPVNETTTFPEPSSPTSSVNDSSKSEDITDNRRPSKNSQEALESPEDSTRVSYREESQLQYSHTGNLVLPVQAYPSRLPDQIMPAAAINGLDKARNVNNKPFIYSFQETTFSRRLQRAAVECGYHLIAQAHLRPKVFKRVFKLSLLYGSREQIAARFKSILTKSTSESLEFWQTPFIRLGGAGTHYPRLNDDGTAYVAPNTYNVRQVGPDSNLIQLRSVDDGSVYCDLLIDISGYEGEWFDPTDIEGYLASKGIYIDPQSSFADFQIPESELPELSRSPHGSEAMSSSSNPTTPPLQGSSTHQEGFGAVSSYLSDSFFNDWHKNHMTTFPTDPQDAFLFDFDPTNLTNDALGTLSKRVPGTSTTTTTASPSTAPSSLLSPTSLLDHSISAFVDSYLASASPIPFSSSSTTAATSDNIISSFPVDFDNIPLDEQNTWGFQSSLNGFSAPPSSENEEMDTSANNSSVEPRTGTALKGMRNVTIDVTRLIEELLKGGVCLGRAPGFRKKDVDRALETAMITAF
ncbi:hypothetical protein EV356DRAFT_498889 [Viridothelium virens]|uniref:BZIP domain-containing protein n=1 Tax=Viridothelium virens TaxID=1048519 RepID=A0A6A6HE01_VIRVR|nr:hypothetical protein EV356DRAFT_498889 [Viridothelium virens]